MRNISLVFGRIAKPISVALVLLFVASSLQAQDAKEGESIFRSNCSSCHRVFGKFLGPELAGINERREEAWLLKWIHNAPAMIAAGDPIAKELDAQYPNATMSAFPQLSEDQIKSVLAYIKSEEEKSAAGAADGGTGADGGAGGASGDASSFMIVGLIAVIALALVVILVLNKVIRTLERVITNNKDLIPEPVLDQTPGKDYAAKFRKLAKNKKLVFFAVLMLVVFLASAGWKTLWNVGVHEGYQPVQPIKFSHQLHAGVNQIDCQYCHGGAYKSKNASIPSANVCMNCHKAVTGSDKYDGQLSPEIAKIYRALDYNPETMEYGTNQRPIEWVRIHNLPDFAYFNHSQHVAVAGVECQTCHGPIETMEEVYQYSPLTMKWCVDCHQETEVNHKGNAYYDELIAAHEKLKKGEKITAAMLGGLECGKCHY
ncbi:Cytochrome c, mono-and diheme variants [Parapedobacter composti]|uniref:Cytochrome c, mono-and diheme variants n=1 Tax=Parapedobacter composti TaxID=623281 RepID=A0A1I1ECZ4_9SPHI|nr:c-type cytochrome [Parapedobacter composti]SFB82850.1 Cytochrome c, mono-and diheme variants [Parapedobacter composti]